MLYGHGFGFLHLKENKTDTLFPKLLSDSCLNINYFMRLINPMVDHELPFDISCMLFVIHELVC